MPTQVTSKPNSSNVIIVLKAEATLLSVLKTLDGDYSKNQDSILSVLSDMLGKSFDLILSAASSTGCLNRVVSKLVKLNQCSRQVVGEAGKASTTRCLIFDISFLMLCSIVQQYGLQVVSLEEESFFEEWCKNCMMDIDSTKNPTNILGQCDQGKVDLLLGQYLQTDSELKTSLVFWHELCVNSVGVVYELLMAWENECLKFSDIQKVLDIFRSKVCCLPICITTWLCAYIRIMPEKNTEKAKSILMHLLSPIGGEEPEDTFKERYLIMTKIINQMIACSYERHSSSLTESAIDNVNPQTESNWNMYKACWKQSTKQGMLDIGTAISLKYLFEVNGANQFVCACMQVRFSNKRAGLSVNHDSSLISLNKSLIS